MAPVIRDPTHPQVYRLEIADLFGRLSEREKHYSHHLARAAWHGSRIILRQVSPESAPIFDFILELHRSCQGDWTSIATDSGLQQEDVDSFLRYAAIFLSNIGNYYGSGDQKFVPTVSHHALGILASRSPKLARLYSEFKDSVFAVPPFGLGFPGSNTQSSYYPGLPISRDEISLVAAAMDANKIFPENTRMTKDDQGVLHVHQASVLTEGIKVLAGDPTKGTAIVKLLRGDHAPDLAKVCESLVHASSHAANETQRTMLAQYVESFTTGSLDMYRDSQRSWIADKAPKVENIFGFVEPYRDPAGVRAEFEGLVAIADAHETKLLTKLVMESDKFIRRLPWVRGHDNDGKGPFEKNLFEPPDFSSIHALAYCSSIIFPGINLPNYNDIRQETGFKNVIIANRMAAESTAIQWPFVDESEMGQFRTYKHAAYYWWVVLHELLGHGTGRMMVEETPGRYNFDITSPPLNPLSGTPIQSWYRPGQTWTGQFGDLATTVDECRAELVGAYLMDDKELLELFGFTEETEMKASEVTYNLYQQLGVDGLRGLANFNLDSMTWGQAHARAHFAMLKCLLRDGDGCISITHDAEQRVLRVKADRSKVVSHGKPALGNMLLRLHMYRCTADVKACRDYYGDLSRVDGEFLEWRETVLANKPPPMLNVQANTFEENGHIILKQYPATIEGVIQSWVERNV
ncbi:peptidase family M49-domain-containing protein [Stachybotrys elegans]|uniref:Dipeptidyl peptidase 3 n=1 Tax=Stachybotrys elegans TaxID=80388 RepID=A0A8K0WL61_9HYPO|nr:peptidase family M49-domain-containing protein [Stachybotrys elegans]